MSLDYLIEHVGVEPPVFGESHSSVTWWKCDRGPQWRAYAERKLNPSWQVSEIRLLNSLQGPNSGEIGKYHYVVETDISKAAEDEFNAWYDTGPSASTGNGQCQALYASVRFTSLYRLLRIIVSFCYGKQGVVGCPTHGMELKNSTHVLKHGTRIIYTTLLRIRT